MMQSELFSRYNVLTHYLDVKATYKDTGNGLIQTSFYMY